MRNRIAILSLIYVLFFIFSACSTIETVPVETEKFAMGTFIIQRIYSDDAENISNKVIERIKKIEEDMTINKQGGEINSLNGSAGKGYVNLSQDTLYVLAEALRISEASNGAFDVTVGPLVKAWGVSDKNPIVPLDNDIKNLLNLVNYKDLQINMNESKAKLNKEGQIVDVGGIAKGYATDEALDIYRENGVKSALISLGGNVAALGCKPDGSYWRIGIRNPRGAEGSYIGVVSVKDQSVVSSGDYERNFEKDGIMYHHIIDPETGYPAKSGLIATTIVSDISIEADALSTTVFVLGLDKGMEFIEGLDGVEAVFITEDKKIYITKGLKDKFKIEDESKEFEYVEKG
jgi:thiamine biosynthesis lipoprotein